MANPTWAALARDPHLFEERRVICHPVSGFTCPFCKKTGSNSLLKKTLGHRCRCGALFSQQQAIAYHEKGKPN